MEVKVKSMHGWEPAFVSMFISKRTYTPELGRLIDEVCADATDRYGFLNPFADEKNIQQFNEWLGMLLKMGRKHITVLRFVDITLMTTGMHRGGQDDIDSHAKRFSNRIIRSSTRLARFDEGEKSEWYQDKIMTDGEVAKLLGIQLPDVIERDNYRWVKTTNGYVREDYANSNDARRGLYMLSIPSDFVSKIDLCEWAHVYQQRNELGTANPEVKIWAEMAMATMHEAHSAITGEYLLTVKN